MPLARILHAHSAPNLKTCLCRFGILVALNAAAHQVAPALPTADAAEQTIAQRLQAQASGG